MLQWQAVPRLVYALGLSSTLSVRSSVLLQAAEGFGYEARG